MTVSGASAKSCDSCGAKETALVPCGDHFHYFCPDCARIANEGAEHWQCEACGTIYAEYVNGCPKCWDKGLRAKVVATNKIATLFAKGDRGDS